MTDTAPAATCENPKLLPPAERRAAVRFDCSLDAVCLPISDPRRFITIQAHLSDISKTGVALILPRDFEAGSELVMEIELGDGLLSRPLHARVVHSDPHHGDAWLVGCVFVSPLSINELIMLV